MKKKYNYSEEGRFEIVANFYRKLYNNSQNSDPYEASLSNSRHKPRAPLFNQRN